MNITCPLEKQVAEALALSAIPFVHESDDKDATNGLDFFLPGAGVYVEVKQFHTDRIAEQMSRAPNVIALQGAEAVKLFCLLLQGHKALS